jgi:hypothetical protein
MRRWERPIHDFLAPYFRGLIERTTDTPVISAEVEHRRDLDRLTDMLGYLRSLKMAGEELEHQVPPRPQHIYVRARTRRPSRFALHSGVPGWISPLRRPGNTSFPTSTSTYETPPHRGSQPPAKSLRWGPSRCRSYVPPGHQRGHPVVSVPDSALTPGASMTP